MVFRRILARFSILSVVLILLLYFPLASCLSALSALVIWRLFNACAGSRPDLAAYASGLFEGFWNLAPGRGDVGVQQVDGAAMKMTTKGNNEPTSAPSTLAMSGRYDLGPVRNSSVERSPLRCRSMNVIPPIYDTPKPRQYVTDRYAHNYGGGSSTGPSIFGVSRSESSPTNQYTDRRSSSANRFDSSRSNFGRYDDSRFDDSTYEPRSPSLAAIPRSSLERSVLSPSLPLGCYPWIAPKVNSSTSNDLRIEKIPVQIRISKPSRSIIQPSDEPASPDSSRQIINAFKVQSRKRTNVAESDEDANNSDNIPKKRPIEFEHNLYCSQLNYTDSSHEIVEAQEESTSEAPQPTNCEMDGRVATPNGPTLNIRPANVTHLQAPPANGLRPHTLPAHVPTGEIRVVSNKRLRPLTDSGDQQNKKRGCDEIVSSLSSSIALLDPTVVRPSRKRRNEDKSPGLRQKTRNTMASTEVQTLPSPIPKDVVKPTQEDKGTETDKIPGESRFNGGTLSSFGDSVRKEVTIEKKMTGGMAAALLKSALKKFADSGDLITPDTSVSSSAANESSIANSGISSSPAAGEQPATTEASPVPTLAFSFGQPPSSISSVPPVQTSVTSPEKPTPPTTENKLAFSFGAPATAPSATPAAALAVSSTAITSPVAISTNNAATSANSAPTLTFTDKPAAFTFGQPSTTSATAVTSAPITSGLVSSLSSPKMGNSDKPSGAASVAEVTKPTETNISAFTFGANPVLTSSSQAQNTPASTQSVTALTTSTAVTPSPFTFGQTGKTVTSPFKLPTTATAISSAPVVAPSATPSLTSDANPKPGGFSFTPSKPVFGTATSTAPPQQSAFVFGSNATQKTENKSLFGMPQPPATAASTTEPPKLFGSTGGFNFSSKDANQSKSAFAVANVAKPTAVVSKPETGTSTGGFAFGAMNRPNTAPTEGGSSVFSFGSSAGEMPKTSSAFAFSGSATTNFSSGFGARTTEANPTTFGAPTTTAPPSFFGTTSTPTSAPSFGSSGFTAPTPSTTSLFGAPASTAPTTTTATAPAFGTTATPAFGSSGASAPSAPVFGSTASFGASQPAFGSNQSAFGVSPPSFGSVASTTQAQGVAAQPTPSFGSTATSSFGTGGFGLSATTPSFGSSAFGSAQTTTPAFGSAQSTAPAFGSAQSATPAFGSSQSTTPAFGSTQSATPAFGSTQSAAPAFGSASAPAPAFGSTAPASTSTTQAATPFSFSAISSPPAGGAGGFNFGTSAAPKPMFQFGSSSSTTNATAAPAPAAPFSFQGAPAATPGAPGVTMFSIGSGSSAPRSRSVLRARKK